MNTRITALENAGGGSIKTISKTTDEYGEIYLSKTTYNKLLFATAMEEHDYNPSTHTDFYHLAICYSEDNNNWGIRVFEISYNISSVTFEPASSEIPVLIGYTN